MIRRLGVVVLMTCGSVEAAFEMRPVSAAGGGLGDASTPVIAGVEALFSNPGGMALGRRFEASAFFAQPFGLRELAAHGMGIVTRRALLSVGLGIHSFGYSTFRERSMLLAAAIKVRRRSGLGIRIRFLSLTGEGFGGTARTAFDLGARVQLTDKAAVGMMAWNAGGASPGFLGRGGTLGFGFDVSQEATISISVRKDAGRRTGYRTGLEIRPTFRTALRVGAGSHPESLAAGVGVELGSVRLDYAASEHSELGLSHRVSVRFLSAP